LLRLIAEGRRNKEIATELKLSVNSIETYRSRLMKKVGCPSPAELVRYAVREGIAVL
jgi:DNA-binding NarL/FixJ family response regulator